MKRFVLAGEIVGLHVLPETLSEHSCSTDIRLRENDHELLSAVTGGDIDVFADGVLHDTGHLPQDDVTLLVPIGVVEILEMIDVKQGYRKLLAVPA